MSSDAGRTREEPTLGDEDRPGPPPLMTEDPIQTTRRSGRGLSAFLALFVLMVFAGIVWYAYDQGRREGSEAVAPLIKADGSPIKVKPENPGGMQVPHQDKLIFDNLRRRGDGDSARVERLLPPPETPLPPTKAPQPSADGTKIPPARTATATAKVESLIKQDPPAIPRQLLPTPKPAPAPAPTPAQPKAQQPAATTVTKAPTPKAPAPAPKVLTPKPAAPKPAPTKVETPKAPPPAPAAPASAAPKPPAQTATAKAPAPAPKAPAATVVNGRFRVQIAALRSEAAARREWARAQKAHPGELGDLTLEIQRIDLGASKGVFFRVRGGPLDEAGARRICGVLSAKRQPCIVARR